MTSHSFKPGPLRGVTTWTLEAGRLTRENGTATDLRAITGGHFADLSAHQLRAAFLDLATPDGRTRIACNDMPQGEHRRQFTALSRDVLAALAEISPDIRLRYGGGRVLRVSLAVTGAAMAALAGALVLARLTGTASAGGVFSFLAVTSFLAVGGGILFAKSDPWRPTPSLTAAEIIAALDGEGAPGAGQG